MANTFVEGTFTGSSSNIDITFGYLDKSHVSVYLNGILKAVGVDYVWNSDAQIELLAGNPVNGTTYLAQRFTPAGLLVDFQPGNLDTSDLNFGFLQAIYIAEEALDSVSQKVSSLEGVTGHTIQTVGTAIGQFAVYDGSGNLVASSFKDTDLSNLAGYAASALASAQNANTYAGQALGYANSALGFRNAAGDFAAQSAGYRDTALTYRNNAEAFKNLAQKYANENEDVVVEPGFYSAKHWSLKAAAAATAAVNAIVGGIQTALTALTGRVTTLENTAGIIVGPAPVSATGASVTVTGIPSGVRKVHLVFTGVTLASALVMAIRLGTSAGLVTSGYKSVGAMNVSGGAGAAGYSNMFGLGSSPAAGPCDGLITFTRLGAGNDWAISASTTMAASSSSSAVGTVSLPSALSQLQLLTTSGSPVFNAGSLYVMWEY